jgi:hypothetical protein
MVIAAGRLHERSPSRLRRPPMGSSLRPAQTSPHPRKRTGGASNLIGDGVASVSYPRSPSTR